ncbi:cytochrome b-c1 complex subunit 9-like [Pan paniscus]|uniref:cytochrome b-c1 complex subunit 9-like n=1 Tax=Pan paniscus TaxID=9597 RepID=UPI00020E4AB2|nr:cytochrome b-c1 complex subunit 9-like [Pan paniscus]
MAMPTLTAKLYSLLFRRTSTFALTIAVGVLFFEQVFHQGADEIYQHISEGVHSPAVCPELGPQLEDDAQVTFHVPLFAVGKKQLYLQNRLFTFCCV